LLRANARVETDPQTFCELSTGSLFCNRRGAGGLRYCRVDCFQKAPAAWWRSRRGGKPRRSRAGTGQEVVLRHFADLHRM